MNYQKLHDTIISAARLSSPIGHKQNIKILYKELHHIKPRCLFQNKKDPLINTPDNLIYLTPRVHFIIHHLLTKMYPTNNKIRYAFHAMFTSPKNTGRYLDEQWQNLSKSRAYGYHRTKMVEFGDILSVETRKRLSNNYKGKRHTEETKRLISAANSGKKRTDAVKLKLSKSLSGVPKSQTHKKNISIAHTGKTLSADHKERIANTLALTYEITMPDGTTHIISNLNRFCKENGLDQGNMSAVLVGRANHHKGFKIKKL